MYKKSLIAEKTCFKYDKKLVTNLSISHIEFNFRIKNNSDGVLLLILNLCLLEKLTGGSFLFNYQKKNIRTFSPIKSVIGCSLMVTPNNNWLKFFLNFFISKKNNILLLKKNNLEKRYINSIEFTFNDFIQFHHLKLSRSNWETFTYLYDKHIYGLDISLRFNTRLNNLIKLYLSILGFYILEI